MIIHAYLDNNATTRLADEALAAMLPYLTDGYLNPSSATGELFGISNAMRDAKNALARLFGTVDLATSFVLTSGASEANSWAVHAATVSRNGAHLVATTIEHPSLLAALEASVRRGSRVDLVPPDRDGRVSVERLADAVRPDTDFVSVMAANHETGVVLPIAELTATVRAIAPGALIHVDATQAAGRIPLSLTDGLSEVDLLSLSAHKFHGPKGIGALFIREGVHVDALIHGSQEDGRRGGTPNSAGAAGLAVAADLARPELARMGAVRAMRDRFEEMLCELVPWATVNGRCVARLPNTSSVTLSGLDAAATVEELAHRGICIASGSACTSGSLAPSHVLAAMGLSHDDAKATLRISLSRYTSSNEVEMAARAISDVARMAA